ncbi:MAG: tetratricopeptide repeat protein [Bacteroidia bacterium]
MIKRLIFACFVLFPELIISQTAQDSTYLKTLADSAFNLIYVNLDSARSLATEVIHLAQEKEMFSHEMDARLTLGYTWYGEYQFDEAIEIFTEGLKMAQTEKAPGIETRFINALAMVYEQKGDFRKALDYYKKGVAIDRQLNDTAGISISLGNLANTYQELGEIDTAISLQKEAILIREKRKDPKVHNNYSNLGTIYHQTGRYDLAIEYYLKGATLRDSLGEVLLEAYNYSNLAALFSKLKNHQKSIYYLEKAETIFLEGDYLRELGKLFAQRNRISTNRRLRQSRIVI